MTKGKVSGVRQAPERTKVSTWLTETAVTSTRTSVGPGSGVG